MFYMRFVFVPSSLSLLCFVTEYMTCTRLRGWIDMLLMTLTFVLTIVWDIEVGIAVSLIISLLLVVRRSAKPRMTILVYSVFTLRDYVYE